MIKNKRLFLIFFLSALLFCKISFVYALEVKYPAIPGLPAITEKSTLPEYVGYFFTLGTFLAGALALVSFTIGAVQLIISAGNPTTAGDAKDRMKGSVLGLVLTFSAFLILQTINPTLVTPTLTPLPGVDGVFYTNGTDFKPAPVAEANVANIPSGYSSLKYKCSGDAPALLVWKYANQDFKTNDNYTDVSVAKISCGGETGVGSGSFKTAFETPGIYYFMGSGQSGFMSEANTATGQIPEPFKGKVKSVKIINDPAKDIYYGVVFHSSDKSTTGGNCFITYSDQKEGVNNNVTVSNSVDIFLWNAKHPETSGDGVDFYSEPYGWNSVNKAGRCSLDQKNHDNNTTKECKKLGPINNSYYNNKKVDTLVFDYTNVNQPETYKKIAANFQMHPGSVRLKGSYLLILGYSSNSNEKTIYCQTFYKDVANTNDQVDFVAQKNIINVVSIFPLK